MTSFTELGFESYPEYLEAGSFRKLTEELIYSNKNAACWICGRTWSELADEEYLLLHHVSYNNLGKEKVKRDVYILCNTDHKKVHFYWWFGKKKTKLIKKNLLKRMNLLRARHLFKNEHFWRGLWYITLAMS